MQLLLMKTILMYLNSEYLADVTNASNSADPAFAELAQIIIDEQNLRMPESAEEARRLYIDLMHEIEALR